jgi:hypothetical protein
MFWSPAVTTLSVVWAAAGIAAASAAATMAAVTRRKRMKSS